MSIVDELARALKAAYDRPGPGGKVVEIHLFAIRNADQLKNVSLPVLLERAGMNTSYKTELRKGMNLAPFVSVR
jgi:hypothetical protein